MNRPPLTRLEVIAVLRAEVKRLTKRGIPRSTAIEIVAEEHVLDPEWVEGLVDDGDDMAGGVVA